jgi:thiazole/oxazole-forming peptide maturase SagD family component
MIEIHPFEDHSPTLVQALAAVPAALRRVFQRIARCFCITSAYAPGLVIVGGELAMDPDQVRAHGAATISATGTGLSLPEALTTCLGEAAELLAQFERPGDVAAHFAKSELGLHADICTDGWIGAALAPVSNLAPLAWTTALSDADARPVLVPSDLVLRRDLQLRVLEPVGALSAGCAAGATLDNAKERAILELIERDAAALWWYGGRPPRTVAAAVHSAGDALLASLRQGDTLRQTTFLDITTDLGIPVLAAISMDPDGRGLACGLGARRDPTKALAAAIRELCQMELSAPLATMKRQTRGASALNASDMRHLQRAAFVAAECHLLRPTAGREQASQQPPLANLHALLARLRDKRIRLLTLDLTRNDITVPVLRAVSPDLQPFVPAPLAGRMASIVQIHGGGVLHTAGTPLI